MIFHCLIFEELAAKDCEDISSILKSLHQTFEKDIEELKGLSVGNKTRTALLAHNNNVELILKGIVDESSLKTQTEYLKYWISKLILCQKTIISLADFLKKRCSHFQLRWKKYVEKDTSDVKDSRYLFKEISQLYGQIYGVCQNIGVAIYDYSELYGRIKSGISVKEENFRPPYVQDPELQVSERVSQINREAENCLLLVNPSKSMLGFSAVRIALESYIIVKLGDKIRQQARKEKGTNKTDIRFTSRIKTEDVFYMIKELFPKQKEYEALKIIYSLSSKTIHRALAQPNYISWGCLWFVMEELEKLIDNLSPEEPNLKDLIKELINEEKIRLL
jgi:hypothetical protein